MIEKPNHLPLENLHLWENFEGLLYQGYDPSSLIFPHIGVSWPELKAAFDQTKLPIADIGSSFSSFPAEAGVRGITVVPIDVMRPHRSSNYREYVRTMLDSVSVWDKELEAYTSQFGEVISAVEQRYLACEVSQIDLPDQSFCISIVHDCVPKHSNSLGEFITKQLPEILRTTRDRAYIYPLEMHRANEVQDLERILDFARAREVMDAISKVAHDGGFSFLAVPATAPKQAPSLCGLFERMTDHAPISEQRSHSVLEAVSALAWKGPKT